MTPRRWWGRAIVLAVVSVAVVYVASAMNTDPRPLRVVLLVGVVVLGLGLVVDGLVRDPTLWDLGSERLPASRGRDQAMSSHLHALEDHLSSHTPTSAVHARLTALADEALRRRHSLSYDDPAGRALLGVEVADILDDTSKRLTRRQIERCVERLEQL